MVAIVQSFASPGRGHMTCLNASIWFCRRLSSGSGLVSSSSPSSGPANSGPSPSVERGLNFGKLPAVCLSMSSKVVSSR